MVSTPSRRFLLVIVALGLAGTALPLTSFLPQLLNPLIGIPVARAQGQPSLGFDCGLGTTTGIPNGTPPTLGTPPVIGDGVLDTTCQWSGDADAAVAPDTTLEPLTSDKPESFATYGGGFNAEVRLADMGTVTIDGFDITVQFDNHQLAAVGVDRTGTGFDPSNPPAGSGGVQQLALTIDNTAGTARLAETVLGINEGADSLLGLTLFRIRFDVIGVGVSNLVCSACQVAQPAPLTVTLVPGAFDSRTFFDPTATLGWTLSFTFTNPVPASPLTFTASVNCPGCGTLTFNWDFDSSGTTDSTGQSVTITAPPGPGGSAINRVSLTATDGTNSATAVQRLPLAAALTGPSTGAVGVSASFTANILGGIPPYTINYRLCPGTVTPPSKLVCSNPNPAASGAAQTNTQSNIYNFAGVYANTIGVKDTASGGQAQSSVTSPALNTNVTGTPQAYTVTTTPNPTNPSPGPVTLTATVAYNSNYPLYAASGDGVVNATGLSVNPPASGTALKTDTRIKLCDTQTVGGNCFTTGGNGLLDPTEWVFLESGTTVTATSVVLHQGTGTRPTGTLRAEVPNHFRFIDATSATYVQGDPVIYDVNTNNQFDASFAYSFNFGDGSPTASVTGGYSATTTHTYAQGTFTVVTVAQETGTAAVSKIQESSRFSLTVQQPVTFDFTLSGPTPGSLTVVQGTTSATSSITATLSAGTTQPITFTATGLPSGVTANFGNSPCSPTCSTTVSFTATAGATTGTVTVTITAAGGGASHSVTLSLTVEPPVTVTVTCGTATVGKPVSCNASASGGSGTGFTFSWSAPGASPSSGTGSSFTITYASKGSNTVTVTATDSNSLQGQGTAAVSVAGQPVTVSVGCGTGQTSGKPFTCTATPSGGTSPYSFTWTLPAGCTGSSTTNSISVTCSPKGSYSISVVAKDTNNVSSASSSASVTVAGQPVTVTVGCGTGQTAGKPFTCTASPSGGTSPYTFTWTLPAGCTGSSTTSTISVTCSPKGSYSVSVAAKDANGVSSTSVSASVTVAGQPVIVSVGCGTSQTSGKPFTCTATPSGGTSPYSFTWTLPAGCTGSSTTNTISVTCSPKGSYSISVVAKDSNNVSSASISASVTVAGQPVVTDFTFQPSSPRSGDTVTFTASASGGTGPYTFSWNFGDGSPAGTGSPATHVYTVTGTVSQTFHVVLTTTDGNAVSMTASHDVIVTPLAGITVAVSCGTATVGKPVTCTATPSGGTGTFTSISWSAPGGNPATGTGNSFTTTYSAKGSVTITATATDSSSATGSGNANFVVAGQPVTVSVGCGTGQTSGKPFTCTATPSGGTSPYTFTWTLPTACTGSSTTNTISVTCTPKGSYSISVVAKDTNSVSSTSVSASVTVAGQPVTATVGCGTGQTSGKPFTCTATPSGGTSPYTFTWTLPAGCTGSSTTNTISVTCSPKGSYSISVVAKDANGVSSTSVSASVTVAGQPVVPGFTDTVTGLSVSFSGTATGGTSPYSFAWDFGDSTTGTGQTPSHTYGGAGTFSVKLTVTDGNGVSASVTHSVTVSPGAITVNVTCGSATAGKPVTCNASSPNGVPPVSFTWSAPNGSPSTGTGASFTTTFAVKGTDTVTAIGTDSASATGTGQASVSVAAQALSVSVTCPGSGLTAGKPFNCTVSATGGTAPYTGTGTISRTESVKGTFTETFSVTDANGAPATGSASVSIAAQPFIVDFTFLPQSPASGQTVTFTATATGGTTPYSFDWNFTAGFGAPTATGNPVQHVYTVTSTTTFTVFLVSQDANGVFSTAMHNITVTPAVSAISVTVNCGGATAGKPVTCNASASGGTGGFTFSWSAPGGTPSTGTGGSLLTNFAVKGTYTVTATATDSSGATGSGQASVVVAAQALTVTVTCPTSGLTAGKPFSCSVSATGGTAPYTGTGSFTVTQPVKGTFTETFSVTDGNHVSASGSASVTIAGQPLSASFTVSPVSPTVGLPATFTATVTGGTAPYSFTWNFGDTATGTGNPVQHTYSSTGVFNVSLTVRDGNGVSTTVTKVVAVVAASRLSVDFAPKLSIVGSTTFVPLITGGTPAFSCTWDFGDGSPLATTCLVTHFYTHPGSFNVTLIVVDSASNTATTIGLVKVQNAPRIAGQSVQNKILPGETENITVTVKNFSSLSTDIVLTVQVFNITGHSNTLFATLTKSFTVGPSSSMSVTLQFTPPAVVADYRDVATITYSHNFGDLNGDGITETVTGTSPFQSRRGFSVVMPKIFGQTVQTPIHPGDTETFTILVHNPAPFPATITLTLQIYNITGHSNTLVTTLTQTVTITGLSTQTITFTWTPPATIADYRDVAQITGTSFQSRRGFSLVHA